MTTKTKTAEFQLRDEARGVLATLRRVPDDVILAVLTRDLDMDNATQCVCGWVLREAIGRLRNLDPGSTEVEEIADEGMVTWELALLYGGTRIDWDDIFGGVTRPYLCESEVCLPDVELAMVVRLEEALARG